MEGQKILIVDFDEEHISYIESLLRPKGFQISVATDGQSGLKKFETEKPDLVILESLLPKLNGFKLCNKILNGRKVPVLMLTGAHNRIEDKKENNSSYRLIPQSLKPYQEEEFLNAVSELLAQKSTKKSKGRLLKSASLFRVLLKRKPAAKEEKAPQDVSEAELDIGDLKLEPIKAKAEKTEKKVKKEDTKVRKESEEIEDEINTKLEEILAEFNLEPITEKTKKKDVKGPYKLILVDDSPVIQKVINLAFSREGFKIHALSDGKEVVESIEKINPDIILIDINLPKSNGYEICEFIKNYSKSIPTPVIFLKEAFEKIDREMIKELDYEEIIEKPFDSGKLVLKVKKIIEEKRFS
jgi:DNA-binding response OmpR family regulator